MSDSLRPHGLQHARIPCPSTTPRAYSNSCASSQWCHPAILSLVVPFSSHLQFNFPAISMSRRENEKEKKKKNEKVCYDLSLRTHKWSFRAMNAGRSLSQKTVREGSQSNCCEQDPKVPEDLKFEGGELKHSQEWSPPGKRPMKEVKTCLDWDLNSDSAKGFLRKESVSTCTEHQLLRTQ